MIHDSIVGGFTDRYNQMNQEQVNAYVHPVIGAKTEELLQRAQLLNCDTDNCCNRSNPPPWWRKKWAGEPALSGLGFFNGHITHDYCKDAFALQQRPNRKGVAPCFTPRGQPRPYACDTRFTLQEVTSGLGEAVHPAFIVNGQRKEAFFLRLQPLPAR